MESTSAPPSPSRAPAAASPLTPHRASGVAPPNHPLPSDQPETFLCPNITPAELSPQVDLETNTPPPIPEDRLNENLYSECTPVMRNAYPMPDFTLPSGVAASDAPMDNSFVLPSNSDRNVQDRTVVQLLNGLSNLSAAPNTPAGPSRPAAASPRGRSTISRKRPPTTPRNRPARTPRSTPRTPAPSTPAPSPADIPADLHPPTGLISNLSALVGPASANHIDAVFRTAKARAQEVARLEKVAYRASLKREQNESQQHNVGSPAVISSRREAKVSREFKSRLQIATERELYTALHENVLLKEALIRKVPVSDENPASSFLASGAGAVAAPVVLPPPSQLTVPVVARTDRTQGKRQRMA